MNRQMEMSFEKHQLDQAREYSKLAGKVSLNILQRNLRVSFPVAVLLGEQLIAEGFCSPNYNQELGGYALCVEQAEER